MFNLFANKNKEVAQPSQVIENNQDVEELTDEMLTAVSGGKRCDGLSWFECWSYTVFG